MKDYQKRVITEQDALVRKLEKLEHFISDEVFKTLDNPEQRRLQQQATAMSQYSYILAKRIVAFLN